MAQAEGRKYTFLDESAIQTDLLETFEFNSPEQEIYTRTEEFSAVCPFSGLPDIATVEITYRPRGGRCIELKSLKYYFTSFRQVGIYQEGVTKRIYQDLLGALGLLESEDVLEVITTYNTRGGFTTICTEGKFDRD
jgi:7-cyano-7-deazaguanine reductase